MTAMNELKEFIKICNKGDDIIEENNKLIINNVTDKFIETVESLFSDSFTFTKKDNILEAEVKIKAKKESIQKHIVEDSKENTKIDLYELAQRIDNDFIEIIIEDNNLVVKGNEKTLETTLETMVNIIEQIDNKLNIEIYNNKIKIN